MFCSIQIRNIGSSKQKNMRSTLSCVIGIAAKNAKVSQHPSRVLILSRSCHHTSKETDAIKSSPVWAWNEWDTLEEVVVGVPNNAVLPTASKEVAATFGPPRVPFFQKNGGKKFEEIMGKERWKKVGDELDELVKVLEGEGVKVVRPEPIDYSQTWNTPKFTSTGLYAAMPRDFLLTVGDELIESTMAWRCRYFEYEAYRPLLRKYFNEGARWTSAPKCTMEDGLYDMDFDIGQEKLYKYVTTELEPCFDAADFIRLGRDIFGQRSHVTNSSAIKWLRRHLAPRGIRVHELEFDALYAMHIDTNMMPVRPGLMLLKDGLNLRTPELLTKSGWEVVRIPKGPHRDDHYKLMNYHGLPNNMLSIDTERILVEKTEEYMIKFISSLGLKPIPVSLQQANNLGGGFHCWTADIRRRGNLESYFTWPADVLQKLNC